MSRAINHLSKESRTGKFELVRHETGRYPPDGYYSARGYHFNEQCNYQLIGTFVD